MEYKFKSAPGKETEIWSLQGEKLFNNGNEALDLTTVSGGQFFDIELEKEFSAELRLTKALGKFSISCTDEMEGEDRAIFFHLISNIIDTIKNVRPDASFIMGSKKKSTIGYVFMVVGYMLIIGPMVSALLSATNGKVRTETFILCLLGTLILIARGKIKIHKKYTAEQVAHWMKSYISKKTKLAKSQEEDPVVK